MEYTREVTLDFSLHEVVPFVRVKQWDASTRSILVYLKKDGETYIPESDITIMFRCEKPDKRGVMLDSQFIDEELNRTLVVDNRDGTVSIELVDQCTVVPGKCYCDLCFIKDDEIISTLPFVLDVRPSPDIAKRAVSTDDFRTLANAIAGGIPSVEITEISGGHRISILDKNETKTFDVMDGDGYSPTVSTSTITGGHRISVQDKNGTKSFDVMDGVDGTNGVDGYSPIVTTSAITGGNRVSIQDKNGTKTFNVMNGTDGTNGSNGADGYSPTVSTSTITGGHRVSIQDKNGTKTVDIMDGTDGVSPTVTTSSISGGNRVSIQDKTGTKSFDVLNGTNGADGTSPTITVSGITGGHRVSATDKSGTETFDVMDGADGISPTITTTEITGGHRLSIQDRSGSRSVDILDGEKGDKGDGFTIKKTVASVSDLPLTEAQGAYYNVGTEAPYRTYMFEVGTGWIDQGTIQGPVGHGVASGGTAGQFLKKSSGTDYDTEWDTVEVPTKVSDLTNDVGYITGMEILSYGNSTFADFLAAYTAKKVVYCRASSNANPATGSQTRLAFMAYVNNADNPTEVEFQYYRSVSAHTASQQGDQVFVYKLTKTAGWTVTTREASVKVVAGTNMTSSYSNGTITLNANTPTKETVGLGSVDNVRQYSATNPPPYPVTSVNGSTGAVTVPTYESKAAASGGTDVSLVTTGEKYNWNTRGLPSGGSAGQVLKKKTATDYDAEWGDDEGGGQFIVNVQYLNYQYKSDKTHKQIVDAIEAGYAVSVRYDDTYYNLYAYVPSSKYVSFSQTRYLGSSLSLLANIFYMSGGDAVDTFGMQSNGVRQFAYPQNPNPICNVYYDDEQARYVFSYEGKSDFSEVFANGAIEGVPVLIWTKSIYDPYGEEPLDAYTEMFVLTDAYTTNEDWNYTGHLVFSRIVGGTVPKIERFEISQRFNAEDTFASATVTYSEEILGSGGTMTISISGFPPNTTTNKTFSEAYAAYQNGSMLFANWNGNFYRLSGVSSSSLSFTKVSVTNDVGVGSSTLTYSSSGAISLSSAGVVKSTPLIIPLLCDDSSDYMDPPSGTLSIAYGGDIIDITCESMKREVILVNGYDQYNPDGTYSCDKYSIVSTVFTPGASGDPDTLTIIFRCLGMRNGVPIVKTINLSGEVYSGQIAVSYSETALATAQ